MERQKELDVTVSADGEKVQTLKAANADKAGMLGLIAENTHMQPS